jgi:hypothetical protein
MLLTSLTPPPPHTRCDTARPTPPHLVQSIILPMAGCLSSRDRNS